MLNIFYYFIVTITYIVNIYVNNQQNHNEALAFELIDDNYYYYFHVFYAVIYLPSFKIVKEIFSKIEYDNFQQSVIIFHNNATKLSNTIIFKRKFKVASFHLQSPFFSVRIYTHRKTIVRFS